MPDSHLKVETPLPAACGSVIHVSCYWGYKLIGSKAATILPDGAIFWHGQKPKCISWRRTSLGRNVHTFYKHIPLNWYDQAGLQDVYLHCCVFWKPYDILVAAWMTARQRPYLQQMCYICGLTINNACNYVYIMYYTNCSTPPSLFRLDVHVATYSNTKVCVVQCWIFGRHTDSYTTKLQHDKYVINLYSYLFSAQPLYTSTGCCTKPYVLWHYSILIVYILHGIFWTSF